MSGTGAMIAVAVRGPQPAASGLLRCTLDRMLPIQQFSARVLAEIVRRQPPSPARTAFAWQMAVGAALARVTKVTLDDDGVLTVSAADERWGAEIDRARDVALRRLQNILGDDIKSVRIARTR